MLAIGLMSGTSMDGIDGSLIETDGISFVREIGSLSLSYDKNFATLLKATEYTIRHYKSLPNNNQIMLKNYLSQELKLDLTTINKLSICNHMINDVLDQSVTLHMELAKDLLAITGQKKVNVIGYHGQTFYYNIDENITIIYSDAHKIAKQLGIKVVNNFRTNDISRGGRGAPLAPIYHFIIAKNNALIPAAIVNIGGISNATIIRSDNEDELIGFDIGPGNCLLDRFIRNKTNNKYLYDNNGKYSLAGNVSKKILKILQQKSITKQVGSALDSGDIILPPEIFDLTIEDGCATLTAFSAKLIISAISQYKIENVIICGGGSNNKAILQQLRYFAQEMIIPDITIKTADEIMLNNNTIEAQLMALLAVRSLKKLPLSYPGTTGVSQAVSGGTINDKFYR